MITKAKDTKKYIHECLLGSFCLITFVEMNCAMEIVEGFFQLYKKYDDAGEVWVSGALDTSKPDTKDLVIIAECFARMGSIVQIPSPVHFKSEEYKAIFGPLMGTRYERKCPDLCVDGVFYEYESYVRPWNKRKLSNMLTDGLRQSDRLIIDCREGASIRQIQRAIRSRLNVNATIREVWVFDGDGVIDVYP